MKRSPRGQTAGSKANFPFSSQGEDPLFLFTNTKDPSSVRPWALYKKKKRGNVGKGRNAQKGCARRCTLPCFRERDHDGDRGKRGSSVGWSASEGSRPS